jgi:hypothetical protein
MAQTSATKLFFVNLLSKIACQPPNAAAKPITINKPITYAQNKVGRLVMLNPVK